MGLTRNTLVCAWYESKKPITDRFEEWSTSVHSSQNISTYLVKVTRARFGHCHGEKSKLSLKVEITV